MAWHGVALIKNVLGMPIIVSTLSYRDNTPYSLRWLAASVRTIYPAPQFFWWCLLGLNRWFPSNRRSYFAAMEKADRSISLGPTLRGQTVVYKGVRHRSFPP